MVVLTALLAPQLLRYVENAREAKDTQNVEALIKVFELACIEYGTGAGTGTVEIQGGGGATYKANGELGSINATLMTQVMQAFGADGKITNTSYRMPALVSKAYSGGVTLKFKTLNADGTIVDMSGGNKGGMFVITYTVNPPVK